MSRKALGVATGLVVGAVAVTATAAGAAAATRAIMAHMDRAAGAGAAAAAAGRAGAASAARAGRTGGAATAATTVAGGRSAAVPHWRIIESVKTGASGVFTAAVATGKATGWAFDGFSRPAAYERNGSAWTQVAFPSKSNEYVTAAGATSPSDVWAFVDSYGHGSRVVHWDGHNWSVVQTFTGQIDGASVVSANDVWVFGYPRGLGVWHYDGDGWSLVGKNLGGGSALSASDVWAYSRTGVDHWNGHIWTSTSVKRLLPPKQFLSDPAVSGIIALSASNVYAVGNGSRQDAGGPIVVLHYNGHTWAKVAQRTFDSYGPGQQISADGHGGLWLPLPGASGATSSLVHYAAGHLTRVPLPVSAPEITIGSVAHVPGTAHALAGGYTHAAHNPSRRIVAVVLQYR
jgi:hypothetical protein